MVERREITREDLERLAEAMAQAIPELDCPPCCECGWVYHYLERSALLYHEEWNWACLANALMRYRLARRATGGRPGDGS